MRLFCNGTCTVRFKNWTEVQYAGTVRLKERVRSTQILNVPYRTAILSHMYAELNIGNRLNASVEYFWYRYYD